MRRQAQPSPSQLLQVPPGQPMFFKPAATPEPSPTSVGLLYALNGSGKHIYGGTVPAEVVARRRAANRAARAARRMHRTRAAR